MKSLVILTKSRIVQEQLVKSFIGNADVNYAAYGEATQTNNRRCVHFRTSGHVPGDRRPRERQT